MKDSVELVASQGIKFLRDVLGGGERTPLGGERNSGIGGLFSPQQHYLMPFTNQKIRQFRRQFAGGKIGQTAHLVQRFISRSASDQAVHKKSALSLRAR